MSQLRKGKAGHPSKLTNADLIHELSEILYSEMFRDKFAEIWDELKPLLDELEFRAIQDDLFEAGERKR